MKEVILLNPINGESMIFNSLSSLCSYMKWNKSAVYRSFLKGYYQRNGYTVTKLPVH